MEIFTAFRRHFLIGAFKPDCGSGVKPMPRGLSARVCGLSLLFLVSCATSSKEQKEFGTEKLLVAAGFTYKEVQTPEQLDKLKKLPQQRLIRHDRQEKLVYLYADAAGCQCLWAGDEKAYERFFNLHREAKLNTEMHKRDRSQGDLWSSGEDATSYVDDIDSGMIPGY